MKQVFLSVAALLFWGCADNPVTPVDDVDVRQSIAHEGPPLVVVMVATDADPATVASEHRVTPTLTYSTLRGFAASVSQVARAGLMRDARVTSVEDDAVFTVDSIAPWGLDRIDQRDFPLDSLYDTDGRQGAGVDVHIIDTGIRQTHIAFGGRAYPAFDINAGGTANDCHPVGHGTHVAATVAGLIYGAAKGVDSIFAYKIFPDCTGSTAMSNVVAGMDAAAARATLPAVVNMSVGGPYNQAVIDAVARLTARGVAVVVSAGNSSWPACSFAPAAAPTAITVAATQMVPTGNGANATFVDRRASFSNYGSCVDIFAPGVGIISANNTSDVASAVLSGTSMASPHAAGVAALILGVNPGFLPAQVDSVMKAWSTKGVVENALTTPNDLLYSGADAMLFPVDLPRCPRGWQKRGLC